MPRLSAEAKQNIVEKALSRHAPSVTELATTHNIGYSTLQKWIRVYRDGSQSVSRSTASALSKPLDSAERFRHLISTAALDEAGIGVYCREHGLYSFQLQQWKNEFMSQQEKPEKKKQQLALNELRLENKQLKRELNRKNSALAETAALLVLKKKASLIWGEPEDD